MWHEPEHKYEHLASGRPAYIDPVGSGEAVGLTRPASYSVIYHAVYNVN